MIVMREVPEELLPYDSYYVHLGSVRVKHTEIRLAINQAKEEARVRGEPILISRGTSHIIIALVAPGHNGQPVIRWARPAFESAENALVAMISFTLLIFGLVFLLVMVSRL